MSRRHSAEKRQILPDPKFGDIVLSKFINSVMVHGKKSVAERIVYGAIEILEKKGANENKKAEGAADTAVAPDAIAAKSIGLRLFHDALKNVRPKLEVRSRRVGGATYQVPVEVASGRAMAMASRWIIEAARGRSENTMITRLAGEILDAANERGNAIRKRDDTHKMAEANKAFAHYRW
ncbi:MAG TPA: 30S ribosomal protein S7 [Rhodospirillaceae bacterium]|nr:30S ribosomal protein S7 [Rhodospirillaceae bacterium]